MKWHWQHVRRLLWALLNADAHGVAVAARYEAARALLNADAHEVALAARYEAARALLNVDAHGVAVAALMRL